MPHFRFLDSISSLPDPFDADAAREGLGNWTDAANEAGGKAAEMAEAVTRNPVGAALIETISGNSPFLSHCANRDPEFLCELLSSGPDEAASGILSQLAEKRKESLNEEAVARALRIAKRRMALTIALADIAGLWSLAEVTRWLSETATATLSAAVAHLLNEAAGLNAFELANPDDPERQSGLIVLGMGKLGAYELNYSSDIDLIVLYDEERITTASPDKLQNRMVRLARGLVRLMEERTADGYVFRTDLRLRPDPSATPLALSVAGAETYYESLGQNWERAAMIKARPVAGDMEAGERFMKHLVPFVWRKNLDFAAIQDIHSIKRQINAHKGGVGIRAAGHNIKLGQGGIREIEFFAQTQQLIWGGREPGLRSPVTVQALKDLAGFGQCDAQTAEELTESYVFLRRVEHRLQMINDEQTQTLPEHEDDFRRLAMFLGYPDGEAFSTELLHHLRRTQEHYGKLFAEAPSLGAEGKGNLVFTGGDSDPETLETIAKLGFQQPEKVDATVRAWHHGRYRAMRSTRAREILTELLPRLLDAMAETPDPDDAFLKFDEFLQGLPAGVQLFSMIQAHPPLMNLLAEIMGIAPRLARHLSGRPAVLDSVLTPDFFDPLPKVDELKAELGRILGRADYLEDALNLARRWAHDRRFQVGVQRLRGLIDPPQASGALSDIAETALECLYAPVAAEFEARHGRVEGSAIAMLALGKLGSREMTSSSDLDLVFIYRTPEDATASDGEKPLAVTQYFARLSQRLINALTTLTSEGGLYEVDMRLRPSGNSGPIATTLESFTRYQAEQAWTWEHMALTRARVVMTTDDTLRAAIEAAIHDTLTRERDPARLLHDVASMRARLAREKPADCLWSLKQLRGGMVDIEFIVQYLVLRHAAENPDLPTPSTGGALDNLTEAGCVGAANGKFLGEALKTWQGLQGMLSLTVEEEITAERVAEFSDALKDRLAKIGRCADYRELEAKVQMTATQAYEIFREIVEEPADALPPMQTEADEDMPAPPL